jgi:putative cardiolipin synthase
VHAAAASRRSDVVISGPASDAVAVRRTSEVVAELVRESTRSLLIVSFAAYRVPEVVAELIQAADRGVGIDIVLETLAEDGGTLRGQHEPAAAFADLGDRATFWTWPMQRRSAAGGSRAALHAKLLVADSRTAFVGSANLTGRGLADNIEAGVIIRDPEVVRRIARHFAALMQPDEGVLERCS